MLVLRKIASIVPVLLLLAAGQLASQNMDTPPFDWQGHRGCRGLLPENTIPAFLKALEFPEILTLELDLAVSKDGQLIVSHEPWMSHHICSKPDGTPVTEAEEMSLRIMDMTYDEIKQYDCGQRGNERFPRQEKRSVHKPTLGDAVREVKKYCAKKSRKLPWFNIEIKSSPAGDNIFHPTPEKFAALVLEEVKSLGIYDRSCVQSFDVRPLQALRKLDASITIALLVENVKSPGENIALLGFQPQVYSPYYKLLRKKHLKKLHAQGIRVVPWTVNDQKAMRKLRRKGVDGIITDYPDLIGGL